MWGQPPLRLSLRATVGSLDRFLGRRLSRSTSGLRPEDSRWRLSPHGPDEGVAVMREF